MLLKKDSLTGGIIANLLEESWKGREFLQKEELQKIHNILLEREMFCQEAEKIHYPLEGLTTEEKLIEGLRDVAKGSITREKMKEKYVKLFPKKTLILNDGVYGAAFGGFYYIYRSKGSRIYWDETGEITYRTIHATIDDEGFYYFAEEMDAINIFDTEINEELQDLSTSLLEDVVGSIENLIFSLMNIKMDFIREYPIEYLLFPRDVNELSSFSIELQNQVWDIVIDLIKQVLLESCDKSLDLLEYLINFLSEVNTHPKPYHIIHLFDFYRENQKVINIHSFNEIFSMIRENNNPKEDFKDIEEIQEIAQNLKQIPTGKSTANQYHDLIYKALEQIFGNSLSRGKKEVKMYDGRKRVDIVFDNFDKNGFFAFIRDSYYIYCPKIFIECKNYSSDPANPEIDQLLGRLGKINGKLGILICREIENKNLLLQRCKPHIAADDKYILFLTDDDIIKLLNLKSENKENEIFEFLAEKWDSLVL